MFRKGFLTGQASGKPVRILRDQRSDGAKEHRRGHPEEDGYQEGPSQAGRNRLPPLARYTPPPYGFLEFPPQGPQAPFDPPPEPVFVRDLVPGRIVHFEVPREVVETSVWYLTTSPNFRTTMAMQYHPPTQAYLVQDQALVTDGPYHERTLRTRDGCLVQPAEFTGAKPGTVQLYEPLAYAAMVDRAPKPWYLTREMNSKTVLELSGGCGSDDDDRNEYTIREWVPKTDSEMT